MVAATLGLDILCQAAEPDLDSAHNGHGIQQGSECGAEAALEHQVLDSHLARRTASGF